MCRSIISSLLLIMSASIFGSAKDYPEFYPQTEQLIEREGYTLLYSSEHKHPRWVIEHISAENFLENSVRSNEFEADLNIFYPSRSTDNDYRNSGYDRGHNAPSLNHKHSQSLRDETFLFSNISPQNHILNNKAWNKLENYIAKKVQASDGDAFIVTGAAYIPSVSSNGKKYVHFDVIGNDVSVPTHWFKVFLQRDLWGVVTNVECFLIPNTSKSKKFMKYKVSIEEIEQKTKLLFPTEYKSF